MFQATSVDASVQGEMQLAAPSPNVELRAGRDGDTIVVLAFPYDAQIVNAVRGIPHRRFDWDTREWWAPVDDSGATSTKNRNVGCPSIESNSTPVGARPRQAMISPTAPSATTVAAGGRCTRAGTVPGDADGAVQRSTICSSRSPGCCRALRDQRLAPDSGAERCRWRPRWGSTRRRRAWRWSAASMAARSRARSRGTARPARRSTARRASSAAASRSTRGSSRERRVHRPSRRHVTPGAVSRCSPRCVPSTTRSVRSGARVAGDRGRADAAVAEVLGGELEPFQWVAVRYALQARRAFWPTSRGRQDRRGARRARADGAFPAVVVCPRR